MKKQGIVIIVFVVGVLLLWGGRHIFPRSSAGITLSATTSPTPASSHPPQLQLGLRLSLPFNPADFLVKRFGLYPFGLKSSEHPEGHAGINIELSQNAAVLAPTDMDILAITNPPLRPDEHNLLAQQGGYKFEFLRVGELAAGSKVGSHVKQGDVLGKPGHNRSLSTYGFHFGVLDTYDNALCPAQNWWQSGAWSELQQLLQKSLDDHKKPYTSLCVSTTPIPKLVRSYE